ncbi:SAM-dependent methyltransferase, partial [Brucella abortus]
GLPVSQRSSRRVFVPVLAPRGTPVSGLRKAPARTGKPGGQK